MINDIPPKQTLGGSAIPPTSGSAEYESLPPHTDPLGGVHPHALVSVHDPSLHGDAGAFPVLKAFQDYLETERQQARKRLVTLTAFFVSLMAIVVGGFIVAFIFLFNRMDKQQSRLDQQQSRLLEAALQERKAPPAPVVPAPEVPSPAVIAAQQATRQIEAVTLNLQTNIGQQLATMGAVANRLDTKVDAQNAEMTKLRETMAAIQKENEKLRTELPKLASAAVSKVVPYPASTPAPGIATAPRSVSETLPLTSSAAPALAGYEETVFPIRGRDGERTILWHAFVPK